MAYLFTYFTSKGLKDLEQIWFSVSMDGLNWTDIGTDEPVLSSNVGTKGIRDPFPIYDKKSGTYYIIGTDLETSSSDIWERCSIEGSRSILIWESKDLINWSEVRMAEIGIEGAGNVWAPEAIYCEEKEAWFVFFASNTRYSKFAKRKQRIYGTFTKDFKTFSDTFLFFDKPHNVIDTTIEYCNGYYYRFSKNETTKYIFAERCKTLIEDENNKYEEVKFNTLSKLFGYEGPETIYLREINKYCLIIDEFMNHTGYRAYLSDDFGSRILESVKCDFGKNVKRHGGIIEIPNETYSSLIKHYKIY